MEVGQIKEKLSKIDPKLKRIFWSTTLPNFLIVGSATSIIAKGVIDFIEVYNFDISMINQSYFINLLKDPKTYFTLFKLNNPFSIIGFGATLATSLYPLKMVSESLPKQYEDTEYGSHGTAKWMKRKEVRTNYHYTSIGWFLGTDTMYRKPISPDDEDADFAFKLRMDASIHPLHGTRNSQVVVFGGPGSRKTTGFILPNLYYIVDEWIQMLNLGLDPNKSNDVRLYNMLRKSNLSSLPTMKQLGLSKKDPKDVEFFEKSTEFIKDKLPFKPFEYEKMEYRTVENNIDLSNMPDFIIVDPKPELYQLTSEFYRMIGYDVPVLDYVFCKYGDSSNALDYILEEEDILRVAKGFVQTLQGMSGAKSANPIWEKGQTLILGAMIAYVLEKMEDEDKNFGSVAKILTHKDLADPESAMAFHVKHGLVEDGIAFNLYKQWLGVKDSLRDGILGGLAVDMAIFVYKSVRRSTNKSTVDFSQLGRKKKKPIALFIFIDPDSDTYQPLVSLTINSIFNQLYTTARAVSPSGAKLENPVYFLADEAANIGRIQKLEERMGTMRGLRIYPMLVFQSLSQMMNRYPDMAWEDIYSQCDTRVFLAASDDRTAEYCSKQLGQKTIRVKGDSQKKGGREQSGNVSTNHIGRALADPAEVAKKPVEQSYVIRVSSNPAIIYKTRYKHWIPEYKINEHSPLQDLKLLDDVEEMKSEQKAPKKEDLSNEVIISLEKERDEELLHGNPEANENSPKHEMDLALKLDAELERSTTLSTESEKREIKHDPANWFNEF